MIPSMLPKLSLKRPALIGVVHLLPLPGSPRWGGCMREVIDHAVADAQAFVRGGADALVIENFGDVPFTAARVPAETVAAMSRVGSVLQAAALEIPFGYNVLRNDARSGLGLAAATGGEFIRVNVHTGAMVTDQGVIQGQAFETIRARNHLCPEVAVWADVHVKHAQPLGGGRLADAAEDTLKRGLADALIISGTATGQSVDVDDLRLTRQTCPDAMLLVGSGASESTAKRLLAFADGLIVGTAVKRDGVLAHPVDPQRVAGLRAAMDSADS